MCVFKLKIIVFFSIPPDCTPKQTNYGVGIKTIGSKMLIIPIIYTFILLLKLYSNMISYKTIVEIEINLMWKYLLVQYLKILLFNFISFDIGFKVLYALEHVERINLAIKTWDL